LPREGEGWMYAFSGEATRGLRLTMGKMAGVLLLVVVVVVVSGRGLYPVKRMTTGRTDYRSVQMADDNRQEEKEDGCLRYGFGATVTRAGVRGWH